MSAAIDFWRSPAGLDCITPVGKRWPEGEEFPAFLSRVVDPDRPANALVLEFGCGTGRLAGCFEGMRYLGIDVSAHAIKIAQRAHPGHAFRVFGREERLPLVDVTLAHTVLLHVPDDELASVVERFNSPRVIVSEILGRHWRREGDPPVFNRDQIDYEVAFAPRYHLAARYSHPYPHYRDTELTLLEFTRC